jgi:hypothetical protein
VRGDEERETLSSRSSGGKPERCRNSREHWLHPVDNNQLGAGSAADLRSISRWSAVGMLSSLPEKRRNGTMRETSVGPWERNKALKSKAHERRKLKETFTGWKANAAERVAKP